MAIVIVNGQQKGGVGKSTMNWCSCHSLSKNYGYSVLFIDTDHQESIFKIRKAHMELKAKELIPDFKELHPNESEKNILELATSFVKDNENKLFNFDLVHSKLGNIKDTISKYYNQYDLIFVDIPGIFKDINGDDSVMLEFYDMVDIILSPLTPGNYDEDASLYFKSKLEELQKKRKKEEGTDMDIWFYINKYENRRRKSESLLESINMFNFPMLNTKIPNWDDFNDASITEDSILNISVTNSGTKNVWRNFMDEIDMIIKQYA